MKSINEKHLVLFKSPAVVGEKAFGELLTQTPSSLSN